MNRILTLIAASSVLIPSIASSQESDCMEHSKSAVASLESDKVRFEQEIKTETDDTQKQIEDKTDDLGGDLPFDIEITMADTEFVLGIPEVTMKDRKIALDIVQTRLTDKRIVFDLPGICMKRKKIAQIPEFHGFTVKWTDVIADVPEPCMKRNEIVMGIPEFWVGRTEFVMGIPEFKMVDQKLKMGLPQFKFVWKPDAAKEIQAEAQALTEKTKSNIDSKSQNFQMESKRKLAQGVSASFECLRTKVKNQRIIAMAPLDGTINSFNQSISSLTSQNAQAEAQSLQSQLNDLMSRREALVKQFSDILADLDIQEKSALNQMGYGQPAAPGYVTLLETTVALERF